MKADNLSYYLGLRFIPYDNSEWLPRIAPILPVIQPSDQKAVGSVREILDALHESVNRIQSLDETAIFLSGGIDSAILAALLPRGTRAYTIDFMAEKGMGELEKAELHAKICGLDLKVVTVGWQDYKQYEDELMVMKKAPLHAVEVALHKAALIAKRDGVKQVLVGNGADSTFGGMDKLLSRDWTFEEFFKRYTFIHPEQALKEWIDLRPVYEPYRRGEMIDYIGFLKNIHGIGIIQAFNNSVQGTGIKLVEPFEEMKLKGALDLERIRHGEPKYLLFELFRQLFPGVDAPGKIPFARPMDEWLSDYKGPNHPVFLDSLDMEQFSGDQKYLFYCLDRFLYLLERGIICQ